jgi:hypothetical protein
MGQLPPVNRPPKHPHTSKNQDNRQAECGGQVFYTESLTENIRNGQREWGVGGVLGNRLGCVSGTGVVEIYLTFTPFL